jgi:hypothetical protein
MEVERVLLVGILATACMSLCLYLIHWSGFANGDMVRALGSLAARRYENSLPVGWMIHFSAGAFFSVIYALGFPVSRRAYASIGVGWLMAPTRWPGLRDLADLAHRSLARSLLRLTGRVPTGWGGFEASELPEIESRSVVAGNRGAARQLLEES